MRDAAAAAAGYISTCRSTRKPASRSAGSCCRHRWLAEQEEGRPQADGMTPDSQIGQFPTKRNLVGSLVGERK